MYKKILWQNGVPYSPEFGDVYFCRENGLKETNYVFLDGNDLPASWQNCKEFTIIETGFGTGLNFFATWKLWQETALPDATLHYISVEKYPVSEEDICKAISLWLELDVYVEEFCASTPDVIHQYGVAEQYLLGNAKISLTLLYEDVRTALPKIHNKADAWFLDGFAPSKNPDMWNEALYSQMARLTKPGGTFATFTAAGDVRRGLQAHGFDVEKVAGFGRKRHVLRGICTNGVLPRS